MSRPLYPPFDRLTNLLAFCSSGFVWHASTLFFSPLQFSTQPAFHVQLPYRCRTSDWESFLSHTQMDLNPKSNSSALLRTA